jgi:multidrug resistance efflux pump
MNSNLQQNFKGMKESVKSNLSTIRTIIGQAQILSEMAQRLNQSQVANEEEVLQIKENIKQIQNELLVVIDKQIKNNDEIFNLYTKLLEKVDIQ